MTKVMKRALGLALALALMLALAVPALADADYTLSIRVNGGASASVKAGEKLSVELALSKNDGADFTLHSMQDYIVFDPAYFSVDTAGIAVMRDEGGAAVFQASAIKFGDSRYNRVFVNRAATTGLSMQNEITVLSFELTALKEGSTTLRHDAIEILAPNLTKYAVAQENAAVTITAAGGGGGTGGGGGAGGAGGGSGGGEEEQGAAPVIIDGVSHEIGVRTVTDEATVVAVDRERLNEQLRSETKTVVVPIEGDAPAAEARLPLDSVGQMAAQGATLSVQSGAVSYELPCAAVDTAAILAQLGASDGGEAELSVAIERLEPDAVTVDRGVLVLPPLDFRVTASYGGKSVEITEYSAYVPRVVELTAEQARRLSTALVVEPDGTQRHVPTRVYVSGGKWYAKINSLTDSVYALISGGVSFTDAAGMWYEAAVNEMGSRRIIDGVGGGAFDGGREVSRAEFAAMLVRALGLPEDGDGSVFADVSRSEWYFGAVGRAYELGLIEGKSPGVFDPRASISRQEAMLMVMRAARLTGFAGETGGLDAFTDAASVSDWALDAAKWSAASGLIQGSDGLIRPLASISRAETATVILRLLQKSRLIDIRTVV